MCIKLGAGYHVDSSNVSTSAGLLYLREWPHWQWRTTWLKQKPDQPAPSRPQECIINHDLNVIYLLVGVKQTCTHPYMYSSRVCPGPGFKKN